MQLPANVMVHAGTVIINRKICNELKEAGVTRFQIGLDSSGEFGYEDEDQIAWDTFHSWLRGDEMGFSKTVDAIKIAIRAGIDVSVRYSLCRSNLNDVIKTYQFVSSLGVSKFKFRVLFPDGRAKRRLLHELISGEDMANTQYDLIQASNAQFNDYPTFMRAYIKGVKEKNI